VLLSIGGWTYSPNFVQPASSATGRKRFAETSVQLLKDHGFDGLDLDWEYPKDDNEAQNFVLLLKAVREELDSYQATLKAQGVEDAYFEVTVACPAGPEKYKVMRLGEMNRYLDFFNLMAYDYAGSWDQVSGHQANIYPSTENPKSTPFSTKPVIEYYMAQGIAASKIVLGMPLYGRAFVGTTGPGQPYSTTGAGSWENGIWDYKALPRPNSQIYYSDKLGASFSFEPSSKTLITYDSKEVVYQKSKYIQERGLGGSMWWESSGDRTDDKSLIKQVVDQFGGLNGGRMEYRPNVLKFPQSKYDNLRNGFPGE